MIIDDKKPLFLQVKAWIEDQVLQGILEEEEQIPSIAQIVQFYKINHVTVSKGINRLVDDGIIYKKRGVGMFVCTGAKELLKKVRKSEFSINYVKPMIKEAKNLNIDNDNLLEIIKENLLKYESRT